MRTASPLLGQDPDTFCRVCLGFRSLGSWGAIAHPCPGGTVIFWASRMKVLMPTCVHTGPRGPGRMYTPRKNVWVEVCPAGDTRLQGHRYEATVAWGRLGEAPARIPLSHRQDADHPRRAQRLLRGQTGEDWTVVSEPRCVSKLGPWVHTVLPWGLWTGVWLCPCVHRPSPAGRWVSAARALPLQLPPGVGQGGGPRK